MAALCIGTVLVCVSWEELEEGWLKGQVTITSHPITCKLPAHPISPSQGQFPSQVPSQQSIAPPLVVLLLKHGLKVGTVFEATRTKCVLASLVGLVVACWWGGALEEPPRWTVLE